MDIQLPGMDGLTATRLLNHGAATRDIRIVALTALAISYRPFLKLVSDRLSGQAKATAM